MHGALHAPELLLCICINVSCHGNDGIPGQRALYLLHDIQSRLPRHSNVQQHYVHVAAAADELRRLITCPVTQAGIRFDIYVGINLGSNSLLPSLPASPANTLGVELSTSYDDVPSFRTTTLSEEIPNLVKKRSPSRVFAGSSSTNATRNSDTGFTGGGETLCTPVLSPAPVGAVPVVGLVLAASSAQ